VSRSLVTAVVVNTLVIKPVQLNRFPVLLVGCAAHSALIAMQRGYVVAAFRRSFYIETDHAELVCFGPLTLGVGPLNALCKFSQTTGALELEGINGAGVERRGDMLHMAGIAFSLSRATLWQPPRVRLSITHDALGRRLDELRCMIVRSHVRGFGKLIPRLIGRYEASPCTQDDVLLACAWQATDAFSRWLHEALAEQDLRMPIPQEAARLVGLGPGLTPAGDDFLGGVMIAMRSLGEHALADRIKDWVLPLARTQTNKISLAHLRCAAAGEGAAALHDMLAALNSRRAHALTRHIDTLDAIGHSSGWDVLAGAICAYATYLAARRSADKHEQTSTCA
jgi:hypothetical protein